MAKKRKKLEVGDHFLFRDELHVALEVHEGDKVVALNSQGDRYSIFWDCLDSNEGRSVAERVAEVYSNLCLHAVSYFEKN